MDDEGVQRLRHLQSYKAQDRMHGLKEQKSWASDCKNRSFDILLL